jgi:hypothetical protein
MRNGTWSVTVSDIGVAPILLRHRHAYIEWYDSAFTVCLKIARVPRYSSLKAIPQTQIGTLHLIGR